MRGRYDHGLTALDHPLSSKSALERGRMQNAKCVGSSLPIKHFRCLRFDRKVVLEASKCPNPLAPPPHLSLGKVAACFEGDSVPRRDAGQRDFFEIPVSPRL